MFSSSASGLGMLQAYDDTDSDEVEEGVEEVTKDNKTAQKSEGNLLPVPENVLGMFSSASEDRSSIDDPSLHMGRQRSFPHVRGNWASFICLPCTERDSDGLFQLRKLIDEAALHFQDSQTIHLNSDLHVTLSRTVPFRHHWIEPFVSSLKSAAIRLESVQLALEGFDVYINDEKTRTFISMNVVTTECLLNLTKICDQCLAEYQMPPYYKDASYHISCAWMLGDSREWVRDTLLPYLNRKWHRLLREDADLQFHQVDLLELKTGNTRYQFPFKSSN